MEEYLVVRAHGLKLRFLKPEDYARLLGATSIREFFNILSSTDYSGSIEGLRWEKIGLEDFFKVVFNKYVERVELISGYAPSELGRLLRTYALGRYELINLKRALRAKALGERIEIEDLCPVELHIHLNELVEAEGLEELLYMLRSRGYRYASKMYDVYVTSGFLGTIECGLEADYYSSLYEMLKEVAPAEGVREILDIEADLRWLYWCIVFKFKNLKLTRVMTPLRAMGRELSERIGPYIEEAYLGDIPALVAQVVRFRDLEEALSRAIREEDYVLIEHALSSKLYREAYRVMRRDFVSLAYVFAFILACEMEMRNLNAIFTGKKVGLPSSEIQRFLFTY